MTEAHSEAAIGIDVGGTAVKGGIVTSGGRVLARRTTATGVEEGGDHVIGRLARLVDDLRREPLGGVRLADAVGLGMPGTLSRRRGVVIAPPNLPGWRDVPIVGRLSAATGLRGVLDNDANNAALGEYLCGAGRGVRDMALFTLGTGIGGGLILDGKLWRGHYENGGELGHMIVHVGGRRCGCGPHGCLEAYASATSIVARLRELVQTGRPSRLSDAIKAGESICVERVLDAAEAGDEAAASIWNDACRYLAVACANVQHVLNVQRIVLSGGLSGAGERLRRPVAAALADVSSRMLGDPPELCIAELGNDAGFIGSAMSVFHGG